MKYITTLVAVFFLASAAHAAQLTVSWNANTEPDLAGYKVYYASPGDPGWAVSGDEIAYTLGTLPHSTDMVTEPRIGIPAVPGPYAVAVTAIDTSGNESRLSEVVSVLAPAEPEVIVVPTIDLPPARPAQIQVIINLGQ